MKVSELSNSLIGTRAVGTQTGAKYDTIHSSEEERYITIGQINGVAVVVMVVYTERDEVIRIISARLATVREREAYYNAQEY